MESGESRLKQARPCPCSTIAWRAIASWRHDPKTRFGFDLQSKTRRTKIPPTKRGEPGILKKHGDCCTAIFQTFDKKKAPGFGRLVLVCAVRHDDDDGIGSGFKIPGCCALSSECPNDAGQDMGFGHVDSRSLRFSRRP